MTFGELAACVWLATGAIVGAVFLAHDAWFIRRQGVLLGAFLVFGVLLLAAGGGPLSFFWLRGND
jgi:hypothetical protein